MPSISYGAPSVKSLTQEQGCPGIVSESLRLACNRATSPDSPFCATGFPAIHLFGIIYAPQGQISRATC